MGSRPKFSLTFAPEAPGHLEAIEPSHQRLIEKSIDERLTYLPQTTTRDRKALEQPAPLRIYPHGTA